jgi:microcompartment protein CcmK/EutM
VSAVFFAIALAIAAACVALAGAHLRRVLRAASPDVRTLALVVKRFPREERLAELARRARPDTWEHRLAQSLLETSSKQARVAAANEALADIEITLSAGSTWAGTAMRLCARSMLCLAIVAALVERSAGSVFAVLAVGGAGTLACLAIGYRARSEVRERREAIDALVSAVLGPHADQD